MNRTALVTALGSFEKQARTPLVLAAAQQVAHRIRDLDPATYGAAVDAGLAEAARQRATESPPPA